MNKIAIFFAALGVMLSLVIAAGPREETGGAKAEPAAEHTIVAASDLKWADAPAGLPPGAKMAVLSGNPNEPGMFTVRLQSPAGYKIMPHTHPSAENITVISGKLHLGMGEKFDESAGRGLAPGDFAMMPKGMAHFVWTSEPTIVQIHSTGPFDIIYVNPADDPRGSKK